MEIQKIPTLAEKQEFWAEQLPNFKAKYWLPSHFKFVAFDMEQGSFDIKDGLDPSFEDDVVEIWHRVNTGWAMWKKAINFGRKQAQSVPESFEQAYSEIFSPIVKRPYPRLENGDYKYIEIDQGWKLWQAAAAQAVPEGFVLVEKELSWVKADHLACAEWEKNKALFCTENRDITALQIEEYRLRWCKNKAHKIMSEYKAMIEAQEQK